MRVVITSPTADWSAPLAALLRERGIEVATCDDVFDAVDQVRRHGAGAAVLHADLGGDDLRVAMRGMRRDQQVRALVVGPIDAVPEGAEHIAEPWAYVAIAGWCADATGSASTSSSVPAVIDAAVVRERLRLARHATYHDLLGVALRADVEVVEDAARRWLEALSPTRVPAPVAEALGAELREIRAALADARAVLVRPALRAVYEGALDPE